MGHHRHRSPAFARPTLTTAQNAACCAIASSGLWGARCPTQAEFTSLNSSRPASVVQHDDLARTQRQPRPGHDFKVASPPKCGAFPPQRTGAPIYDWPPLDRGCGALGRSRKDIAFSVRGRRFSRAGAKRPGNAAIATGRFGVVWNLKRRPARNAKGIQILRAPMPRAYGVTLPHCLI